jgi:archaellum component FlaD/FlaE
LVHCCWARQETIEDRNIERRKTNKERTDRKKNSIDNEKAKEQTKEKDKEKDNKTKKAVVLFFAVVVLLSLVLVLFVSFPTVANLGNNQDQKEGPLFQPQMNSFMLARAQLRPLRWKL